MWQKQTFFLLFSLSDLHLKKPEIYARISPQGEMNWLSFFKRRFSQNPGPSSSPSSSFAWKIDKLSLEEGAFLGRRFCPSNKVGGIKNMTLSAEALSSESEGRFSFGWQLDAAPWLETPQFLAEKRAKFHFKDKKIAIGTVRLDGARALFRLEKTGLWASMRPPSLVLAEETQQKESPWVLEIAELSGQNMSLLLENEKTQEKIDLST